MAHDDIMSRDEVAAIAKLAKLSLSETETVAMTQELNAILDHVALLQELDLDSVVSNSDAVQVATPLRADEVTHKLTTGDALREAPTRDGSSFVVPKVVG
jgi:aspartyl-tRNA(Asn)/glutamyl-tRNA(Gln) amidotransferase subunit C